MIEMRKTPETGVKTPVEISVMQIDQDLKDGVSKSEMAKKYNIKPWEVDEIFKHPFLKGRRPSRKKALSFTFVDDSPSQPNLLAEEVDPNQVTLEDAIDEAIESVEEVKDQMQQTQEAIIDMLSPAEPETSEETLVKAAANTIDDLHQAIEKSGGEIVGIPNGDTMSDTDDDEEIEMDDDTFEL
jgi:hypothetical protein